MSYQYPDDSIGNGKSFIYTRKYSSELLTSKVSLLKEQDSTYRIVVNYEGDILADSSRYYNGKLIEMYAFYMSGDRSATKAIIAQDTIMDSKAGKIRRSKLIYPTEFNTYIVTNEESYVKDSSAVWKGKKLNCLIVNNKMNWQMIPKSGADSGFVYKYNNYGTAIYGKGIGNLHSTVHSRDTNDTLTLKEIKD
jgi:hypothetical protein